MKLTIEHAHYCCFKVTKFHGLVTQPSFMALSHNQVSWQCRATLFHFMTISHKLVSWPCHSTTFHVHVIQTGFMATSYNQFSWPFHSNSFHGLAVQPSFMSISYKLVSWLDHTTRLHNPVIQLSFLTLIKNLWGFNGILVVNDLPPFTIPFVHIADMDKEVITVTTAERSITSVARPIPAWPVTQDRRRKSITPHIFNRHLIWNTKSNIKYRKYMSLDHVEESFNTSPQFLSKCQSWLEWVC